MSDVQRSPPSAGSKRKIEEVEDAERVDRDVDASQRMQLLSDSESEHGRVETSGTLRGDTSYETVDTSFQASQQYSASQNVPELHFELPQDEMSQRTREQLGAVPLPQNTSQLPPNRPNLFNEASAGSVGLSTFLNLDDQTSSQASVQDQMAVAEDVLRAKSLRSEEQKTGLSKAPVPQDPVTAPTSSDSARKEAIVLATEQMKARLQLALFKVQSNQTKVPFSRLKRPRPEPIPQTHPNSPHIPATFAQPQLPAPRPWPQSSSTVKAPSSARTISAPQSSAIEAQVPNFPQHVTAQGKSTVPDLSAFPHPVIKPTTFSARWNNVPQGIFQPPGHQVKDTRESKDKERDTSDHSSQATQQHFPSSPPLSRHNSSNNNTIVVDLRTEDLDSEGAVHHALIDRARQVEETTQLSSPPDSTSNANSDAEQGKNSSAKGPSDRNLAATAGEAASGLLALMQG